MLGTYPVWYTILLVLNSIFPPWHMQFKTGCFWSPISVLWDWICSLSHAILGVLTSILLTPAVEDWMCFTFHAILSVLNSILVTPAVQDISVGLFYDVLGVLSWILATPAFQDWTCAVSHDIVGGSQFGLSRQWKTGCIPSLIAF